ncbi:toll-like receptor 4 [Amia ocellicauda]|uniref:toll-like receptor 4 n=1 Tax=Amia ocellicauda TaxID=2972642 RepID=UPI003464A7DA
MGLNLSRIPADIPPTVQTLDFSFNRLEALRNNSFPLLPDLTELDLTRCNIKLIEDHAFQNVQRLSVLTLTGNPIEHCSATPFSALMLLHKLVVLDIGISSFEDLTISSLVNLKELKAGTNKLSSMKLPPDFNLTSLTLLDLHNNNISSITVEETWFLRKMHTPNLTVILSRNKISYIEHGAFRGVYIKELNLRSAFLSPIDMKAGLQAMAGLNVFKLVLGNYRNEGTQRGTQVSLFDGLCEVKHQEMHLIHLKQFPINVFHPNELFPCLINASVIKILSSRLSSLKVPKFTNLKVMDLSYNYFDHLPSKEISNQPTLETFVMTNNNALRTFLSNFSGLPNLKHIDISRNALDIKGCCHEMFAGVTQLKYLNLSHNVKLSFEGLFFNGLHALETLDFSHTNVKGLGDIFVLQGLKKLKYLDMSYTDTYFVIPHTLADLYSLEVLKMAGNSYANISAYFFKNLKRLEFLDVSNCQLEHLHWSTFAGLEQLQHLILTNNRLTAADFLTHPSLGALKTIHIGTNNIITIPQHTLDRLPKNLTALDLSQNPIECTCAYAGFIKWTIENKAKLTDQNRILCQGPVDSRNTKVTEFDVNYCRHMSTIIITLTLGVVLLIFFLTLFVYKYQFYIRYACILLRGYRSTKMGECAYDAFVIYSSRDELWVMDELVENLENGVPPLQLCLHVRDFEVGKSITSNIIDEGILNSRKAIVVISQYFIESAWCKFEFEMAQSQQFFEGKPGIIAIILEDVEENNTKRMLGLHKYLKNNTYLKWKDNPMSRMVFWTRLKKAIISER